MEINQIENYINDIIEECQKNPLNIDYTIKNFELLIEVMKKYEKAPKYFNSILEETDSTITPPIQGIFPNSIEKKNDFDQSKHPVMNDLEKIFNRKLKQKDLQLLGNSLSQKTGLKLDRDTKRSKTALIQWFHIHWQMLHPKIYEYGLNRMEFSK